jgi:hypothetical protein
MSHQDSGITLVGADFRPAPHLQNTKASTSSPSGLAWDVAPLVSNTFKQDQLPEMSVHVEKTTETNPVPNHANPCHAHASSALEGMAAARLLAKNLSEQPLL